MAIVQGSASGLVAVLVGPGNDQDWFSRFLDTTTERIRSIATFFVETSPSGQAQLIKNGAISVRFLRDSPGEETVLFEWIDEIEGMVRCSTSVNPLEPQEAVARVRLLVESDLDLSSLLYPDSEDSPQKPQAPGPLERVLRFDSVEESGAFGQVLEEVLQLANEFQLQDPLLDVSVSNRLEILRHSLTPWVRSEDFLLSALEPMIVEVLRIVRPKFQTNSFLDGLFAEFDQLGDPNPLESGLHATEAVKVVTDTVERELALDPAKRQQISEALKTGGEKGWDDLLVRVTEITRSFVGGIPDLVVRAGGKTISIVGAGVAAYFVQIVTDSPWAAAAPVVATILRYLRISYKLRKN
jgi:hypothetical protein